MDYESWRKQYENSEDAARAAFKISQIANDENAKLHGWLRELSQKPIKERRATDLVRQLEEVKRHRKELLDLIYNCAIGQVAMGYVVDAESLAQSAYSITGITANSNDY